MTIEAAFPLSSALLPGDPVSLRVFEPRFLALVADVTTSSGEFISVLISRGSEVGGRDSRLDHGVRVQVESVGEDPYGLIVAGRAGAAISVGRWLTDDPYPRAEVADQFVHEMEPSERFDCASSITLLAQMTRRLTTTVSDTSPHTGDPNPGSLGRIAAGRWWNERVHDSDVWRAYWSVARAVPCGSFDRYSLLLPATLPQRVLALRHIIEHVTEIISFQFGESPQD